MSETEDGPMTDDEIADVVYAGIVPIPREVRWRYGWMEGGRFVGIIEWEGGSGGFPTGTELTVAPVGEMVPKAALDRYVRLLLSVPVPSLHPCPAQALDGVQVIEGDYCLECPYRPTEGREYTEAGCWGVWQKQQQAALAEEAIS